MKAPLFLIALFCSCLLKAQWQPFRFAFLSDTHIGSSDGKAEEDMERTVADINQMTGIAFVVITGDITEFGTDAQIRSAKAILDKLKIPYYIIPGNHDTGWSESGGVSFIRIFGSDRFLFTYHGITFMGCASGPYERMSDGHIPRDAVNWMDSVLKSIPSKQPLIFLNHYPLDKNLDNWYEAIDRLKQHNTLAVLCGHGHSNHALNFEGIPAVMGRSNLRAKAAYGGYNLVDVTPDSLVFSERTPGIHTKPAWTAIRLENHQYDTGIHYPRPSYAMNDSFPQVHPKWTFSAPANVISTPVITGNKVVFGNSLGMLQALDLATGKKLWSFPTGGAIYSSPAAVNNRIVFGSGDGNIYCLSARTGKKLWSFKTNAAVLGCPLIAGDTVWIGGSDHTFRAIRLSSGKEIWRFDGLKGPVVSTPLYVDGLIIFGAWDTFLYALNSRNGTLVWKWSNGSPVPNLSPAACIPVASDGVVYIAAPDRYLTAIDLHSGHTLWRTNACTVRESIGISADGKWIYGKTMNDTLVAYPTSRTLQKAAWKLNCGFGYEHVPSMPIEKEGKVFFGTRSGVIYAVNPKIPEKSWSYKLDNSMVNTVRVLNGHQLIAATMDGKVALLETQ